jgi:Autographiviridae terminase large subunit
MDQHRLIVGPTVIEQDFYSTKLINGKRGPLCRLCYQTTRIIRARRALLAQDDRLDALAGAVAFYVEHMARDAQLTAPDHNVRELDKELDKFFKRVTFQHGHNSTAQVVIWRSWCAGNEKGAPKLSRERA